MKAGIRSAVLIALRGYKWLLSPLLPAACRYVPSCSEYAMEAIDRHGIVFGGWMAFCRVLRCHPFVKGGFDPVPLDGPVKAHVESSVTISGELES